MSLPRRGSGGTVRRTPTRKEKQPNTPLDLLTNGLGEKDAKLLDVLPLDNIEFAVHDDPEFNTFLGH